MNRSTFALSLVLGAGVLAACGGKVVFEGPPGSEGAGGGAGGNGGTGGVATGQFTTGTTGPLDGSGGASCFTPPDPASLSFCTSGASTGSGEVECDTAFCDGQGNTWVAKCKATGCACFFNTTEVCSCALNGPGDFCNGTPNCCPGLSQ